MCIFKKSTAKWINGQEVSADKCPLQVWWVIPFFRSNCSIEGNAFSRLSFFLFVSLIFGGIYKKVANKKNRDTWYQMLRTSPPYSQKVLVKNGNLHNSRKIVFIMIFKMLLEWRLLQSLLSDFFHPLVFVSVIDMKQDFFLQQALMK